MDYFYGTWEELKDLVSKIGINGNWRETERSKQFRTSFGGILNWYPSTCKIQYQGKGDARESLRQMLSSADYETIGQRTPVDAPVVEERIGQNKKIFVVHGHDQQPREQLELILHRLGLNPFVLANTSGGGLTIIEALENEIGPGGDRARFGIVLLTPDDIGYAKVEGDGSAQPRARQNVVLEMGMLIAALGRSNVAILKKGHAEVPSDAAGILYLPFYNHVRETVPKLVDRLQKAGFRLEAEAIANASA